MELTKTLQRYSKTNLHDDSGRHRSWEHCFKVFGDDRIEDIDNMALNLGFYLASWGMYRGSTSVLQKDFTIHREAVRIIYKAEYQKLKCHKNEVSSADVNLILKLKRELREYYSSLKYYKGKDEKDFTASDTLVSKILLGTLGCVPAYDRYFKAGLKSLENTPASFSRKSLLDLFKFIDDNKEELEEQQAFIKKEYQMPCSMMKIIDMCFWQLGMERKAPENGLNYISGQNRTSFAANPAR